MPELVTYVGDPFVDTGVAVLEHQLGKPCEEFSESDLVEEGSKLLDIYSQKQWRGILTFHFPNSGWTNPTMGADKVSEFKDKVLKGFQRDTNTGRPCEYCRRPANAVVDGSVVPLMSSANSMDCGSGGRTGFAICGYCLFAIQFYPLATLKVEGKALFWWSHDRDWTFLLAGIAIHEVRRFLAASPDGTIKPRFPRSRLLTVARMAFETWRSQPDRLPLRDIIGCHTSNYRISPEFEELRIPRELFEFWNEAASGFGPIYETVVSSAWESRKEKSSRGKKPKNESETEWVRRNGFYESLGAAFQSEDFRHQAGAVAKYFIRTGGASQRPGSFELACLFLERLAGMRKIRIEAIREIGDQIAASDDKKKILERLIVTKNPVGTLVYAQIRMQRAGEAPLKLDTVLTAFDLLSEDDSMSKDDWLARDLIVLRVIEKAGTDIVSDLPELALEEPELAEKGED